jgi:hypothetical protein
VLPQIRLDTEMEALGQFIRDIKVVALKRWDGSIADQGVLVHELVHYIQQFNGVPMIEYEAITGQSLWLQSIGENQRDYISERTILQLTGDSEFSKLDWLEAA